MLPPVPDHLSAGLFGRKAELERLYAFAGKLAEPDARGAILVTGEAGVGKTRLLDEARRLFRKQGALVLEAHCKPGDNRPNGVFVDLFARGVELLEDAGHCAPLLDRAINRLAGLSDPVDSTHSHRGDELLQLCETVRRALLHVATPQSPSFDRSSLGRRHDDCCIAISPREPAHGPCLRLGPAGNRRSAGWKPGIQRPGHRELQDNQRNPTASGCRKRDRGDRRDQPSGLGS